MSSSLPFLKIKKLFPDAIVPKRAHDTDSGVDLYAYRLEKYFGENENAYNEELLYSLKEIWYT